MTQLPLYQRRTLAAYDTHASQFEEAFRDHFNKFVKKEADHFIRELHGKTIIDLGSGPGTHADYFYFKGLDVLCVDYSPEMLRRCAVKGVKALLLNMEDFWMPDKTVDGVWMYHSLVHVRDENVPSLIKNIHRMLRPSGLLALAVREGSQNGYENEWNGVKRWFNYFTDEELRSYLTPLFDVVSFSRTSLEEEGKVYLNYLLRKRE